MIVQISMVRNERPLLEKMLPIWKEYADAFVFMVDTSNDGTTEYLLSVKDQYNILNVLEYVREDGKLWVETDNRQLLFDTARAYSNKIICLDADEYLDGEMSKADLEELLDNAPDTVFHLQWIQYTSANTIRVDGPWRNNYKDRLGSYEQPCAFAYAQMHSTHLPIPIKQQVIDPNKLFIAHLQWLDKNFVAIKQYYWKVVDYVTKKEHGVDVVGTAAYDVSVADFNWEEEYFPYNLKAPADLFESISHQDNYRLAYIIEQSKLHNIPNLGDWGFNIHDSVPMYFCTAADEKHYPLLLNMIGSIHLHNYYDVGEIRVYDIGLNDRQIAELSNFKKVTVCKVEETNPDILKYIETGVDRQVRGLFSWKPVLIKDSLDHHEYVLYLDAGTTVLKPLNQLFHHIKENGYLLFDCGHSIKWMTTDYLVNKLDLSSDDNRWILNDDTLGIDAGFMGVSREVYDSFVFPMYELSKDLANFADDGTCPDGWGTGRHDQTLFSIQARKLGLDVLLHDRDDAACNLLVDGNQVGVHLTHRADRVNPNTNIFRSRWSIAYDTFKLYTSSIKRKYIMSVITGVGKLARYEKFINQYFTNIQQQVDFNRIEFVIIYSEWSDLFAEYANYSNIKFVKEEQSLGVHNAWNLGIQNATADLVTTWNIDDLRYPINNKIKSDLLTNDITIDLAYNWYVSMTPEELEQGVDISEKPVLRYPDDYHLHTDVACMAGPDPVWRKSFHLFGGFFNIKDYSIVGDWEMWLRMSRMGLKFKLIPHVLCIYVDHNDTVSNSSNIELENQKKQLANQYQKR
tara:strand:- start:149 stop:2539 length:2391 start_codon:yes stop_codon:yes gene_type:complete